MLNFEYTLDSILDALPPVENQPVCDTDPIEKDIGWFAEMMQGVPEGGSQANGISGRNKAATQLTGYLIENMPKDKAWPILLAWNQLNSPPLGEKELRTAFQSICKRSGSQNKVDAAPAVISNVTSLLENKIKKNKAGGKIGEDTGFRFMQRSIHGFVKTFFYVFGAYTSVGKTALMIQMIVGAVERNPAIRIAAFSTEMASIHILLRIIANWTAIPSLEIFKGQLGPEDDQRVQRAYQYFSDKNLWLFDNLYTVEAIESACNGIGNLDVVFIDFLQNLHADGSIYEKMSTVPLQLQEMAKKQNTCIVGMSQVNNESVKNSSPVIGFKGAGEIAAACDLGLWLERDQSEKEILKCYIRKNRHGPTGKVTLKYINNFTGIEEVTI